MFRTVCNVLLCDADMGFSSPWTAVGSAHFLRHQELRSGALSEASLKASVHAECGGEHCASARGMRSVQRP